MTQMTSRERVLAALRHEPPDRVPIDLGAMGSTGIMAVAYNRLKAHLGRTDGVTLVCDGYQQLAEPEHWILDLFGVDVIDLGRRLPPVSDPDLAAEFTERFGGTRRPWTLSDGSACELPEFFNPQPDGKDGWVLRDETGRVIGRMPKSAYYFKETYFPLEGARTVEEINAFPLHRYTDETLHRLQQRARWLSENTDYALMGAFGGNILEYGQTFRGWAQFMMDLAGDLPLAEALMDRLLESHLANLDAYLDAVGDYIHLIVMGDDLGTQEGPQLSPELYHATIHPRHKAIYQLVKKKSPGVYVFLHCCGAIYDLLPDLIDEGVDVLNPVQTSAAKMAPERLKREFGDKLCFWGGGCETQSTLQTGSPSEVADQVCERIRLFNQGGGYVFNQIHNIQANVPPENIVAMFQAARRTGD